MTESSQVGDARRAALHVASNLHLDETTRGAVGIVVTELANNLVRHGGGGEILLRPLEDGARPGVEAMSLDSGPGIANIARSLEDGFSTGSTPGTGLGAVRRLSTVFDIHSTIGQGTAVLSRVRRPAADPREGDSGEFEVGAVNVPYPGELESGDCWSDQSEPPLHRVIVADGLGHGLLASQASCEAVRIFESHAGEAPARILALAHTALQSTRGAAAAISQIDLAGREVRFAGVGNVSACIVSPPDSRSMVSHNGTIGHQVRKVQEFVYPWLPGSLLVMHSDGLTSHWRLDAYPGLVSRHPSLIAGVLYRDFKRGRDDVTVVVARAARP